MLSWLFGKKKKAIVQPPLYSVWLEDFESSNKVDVIKAIREVTGLGLKESKGVADRAQANPYGDCIVLSSVPWIEMQRACDLLEEAGAEVWVERFDAD